MKNDAEITDDLIYRYLAGEASPEDALRIDAWLQAHDNRRHYLEIKAVWDATHPTKSSRPVDTASAWAALQTRMTSVRTHSESAKPKSFVFAIAASILLVLTCSVILYLYLNRDVPSVTNEIALQSGSSIRKVSLPDGSEVTLYHNSALVYPEQFPKDNRLIRLEGGEAFFSVASDPTRPFIVHAPQADIRVTGTSFNVLMKGDSLTVSVNEGSVKVYNATDSVTLTGGYTAHISGKDNLFTVTSTADPNLWAYATGKLVFDETRLSEVIRHIEKTYSCSINVRNESIYACRLTARFEDDSAQNILNLIAETLNLSVSRDDSVFTLEGEGCH
ncbi:MAG: FecR domain-containing protein [Bacteroidota bacterium]|jgi:transmembrane sensor|nr:MAG: hypothetical protein DIU61_08560 [Bacteroidota bacterium]